MRRRLASPLGDERGFTLIELLVVLPLLTVMVGGIVLTMTTLVRSNGRTQEQTTLQSEGRAWLNTMVEDVRKASYGDDSTPPIISATATTLTFYSPDNTPTIVTGTTMTSFHLRKLTYDVTSQSLRRQFMASTNVFPNAPPWTFPSMGPWVTLMSNSVTNTDVFTYYTSAGMLTSPPTPIVGVISDTSVIRAVGIKLTLSTRGTQARSFTFNQLVALRETQT